MNELGFLVMTGSTGDRSENNWNKYKMNVKE